MSILVLVGAWYTTSSFNAVSTQQFIAAQRANDVEYLGFYVMTVVTLFQLLVGAGVAAGIARILLNSGAIPPSSSSPTTARGWHYYILVPTLHAAGSLCTNMGFIFGSASVVQIIKLLEPLETLVISRCLLASSSSPPISGPLVASLCCMIAGTIGTLSGWHKPVRKEAVFMATLSGLALASRNSVKKLLQEQHQQKGNERSSLQVETSSLARFVSGVQEFARLSLGSAVVLFALLVVSSGLRFIHSLVVLGAVENRTNDGSVVQLQYLLSSILQHPKMVIFHGLYNLSSLAVLGFVSALTHSVLNVGKRLVNIVVVAVLFQEQVDLERVSVGLSVATAGALWYTVLAKGGNNRKSNNLVVWNSQMARGVLFGGGVLGLLYSSHQQLIKVV